MASAFVVSFQLSWVLSPANAVPLANWTAPVPPTAAEDALVTHTPFTAKHPPERLKPLTAVVVALPMRVSFPFTPRLVDVALVPVALVKKSVVAVSAVDEANGKVEAMSVEVATKYAAVGVLVET